MVQLRGLIPLGPLEIMLIIAEMFKNINKAQKSSESSFRCKIQYS